MTKIADYNAFFSTFDDDENLLICGGDGTLNHFINDLGDAEIPVEVYYFATGTGNDFLNDLEKKPEDGIVNITKYLKNLPEVEVNGKTYKFINGVGYGIDGYCCEVGDKQRAQGKTEINYTSIAIKGLLFYYHPTNAKVTVDGKEYTYKKVWIAPHNEGQILRWRYDACPYTRQT
jgi:diacylglycerol kinase family enzyme